MNCLKCGAKASKEYAFCIECGARLENKALIKRVVSPKKVKPALESREIRPSIRRNRRAPQQPESTAQGSAALTALKESLSQKNAEYPEKLEKELERVKSMLESVEAQVNAVYQSISGFPSLREKLENELAANKKLLAESVSGTSQKIEKLLEKVGDLPKDVGLKEVRQELTALKNSSESFNQKMDKLAREDFEKKILEKISESNHVIGALSKQLDEELAARFTNLDKLAARLEQIEKRVAREREGKNTGEEISVFLNYLEKITGKLEQLEKRARIEESVEEERKVKHNLALGKIVEEPPYDKIQETNIENQLLKLRKTLPKEAGK